MRTEAGPAQGLHRLSVHQVDRLTRLIASPGVLGYAKGKVLEAGALGNG